jgi:hypothetical protein
MGSEALVAAVVLLGPVLSLAGLWLRHRFALRAERERRRYLLTAATLPAGSRVREQRGDGTQLILTVGPRGGAGDE